MPSFAEVPFDMEGVEAQLPAGMPPGLALAIRAMYEKLVANADDIMVMAQMSDPANAIDLSEVEIDLYRTGAVAGITAMLECFMKHRALDTDKFGAYLTSLMRP